VRGSLRFTILMLAQVMLAACLPERGWQAAELARDIAATADPAALDARIAPPRRATAAYAVAGRAHRGDIYRPATGDARAALVLVPGVVPEGKDHPVLVGFARALTGAGFLVLVPEMPNLRALRVGSDDAGFIGDAIRYLAAESGVGPNAGVGLVAFSYAAGPALLAAMTADVARSLRFVYLIGPYYSMQAFITYVTTGRYRRDASEPWSVRAPNPYGRLVLALSCAARLDNPADRVTLTAMTQRRVRDPTADLADLVAKLSPEGRSIYDLVVNDDPERVPSLIAALPPKVLAEVRALDLGRQDLTRLRPSLVLLHGRADPLVPHTQSLALAAAVGEKAEVYLLDNMRHVEPGFSGIGDFFRVWQASYSLLAFRDAMPAPKTWNLMPPKDSGTSP